MTIDEDRHCIIKAYFLTFSIKNIPLRVREKINSQKD